MLSDDKADLGVIVEILNDHIDFSTDEKDYDSCIYFTHCKSSYVEWIEYGSMRIFDSENGDMNPEQEDEPPYKVIQTATEKILLQIQEEMKNLKKNFDIAFKCVKDELEDKFPKN